MVAGISLILFFISIVSFIRMREVKLFFISVALFLFFIKSILAIVYSLANYLIILDLIIIMMLYMAAAKK